MSLPCLFVSDLHGRRRRYEALFEAVRELGPRGVFLGGDLFPNPARVHGPAAPPGDDFVRDFLVPGFAHLRDALGPRYPRVFLICGNDDPRSEAGGLESTAASDLWTYAHGRRLPFEDGWVLGYSYVPPTPFYLKDWERYDVGPHVPPGCVSPEEGFRSIPIPENEVKYATIAGDLETLAGDANLERAILLAHSPPYRTNLDRAELDGLFVDHVPLDVHVGSVAVRRFIEARGPVVSLHGHIHESARLTGSWRDRIGRTHLFGAAHEGPELALVRFDPDDPESAVRELR